MLGMQEAKKRKFCHFYEIMICVESLRHRSLQRHLDDITCPINNEPKVLCVCMCLMKAVSLCGCIKILNVKNVKKYEFHQKISTKVYISNSA